MDNTFINNSKILIVDDIRINVKLIEHILGKNLYTIKEAFDGLEGLKILKEEKIDLVLLDVMMPEIDGYTVCKKMKKDPLLKDIPVIFLTAKSDPESLVAGFEAGAVDYITRPFSELELLARVRTQLKIKHSDDIQKTLISEKEKLISQLENALDEIKALKGLIPICSYCKKVRNDEGFWDQVEVYIENRSDAKFSHGMCPGCLKEFFPQIANKHPELYKDKT